MAHLEKKLLDKIATKLGKKKRVQVNVMVSHLASKLGISSEAALVLIAKKNNIGTGWYQRHLEPDKQTEIRENLPSIFIREDKQTRKGIAPVNKVTRTNIKIGGRAVIKNAVDYILQDVTLRERCGDLLLARDNFDRAINQATLILEERIRSKAQPTKRLVGENLVNYAFNDDLSRTVLQISSNIDEQRGLTYIIRGVVPAFRNLTHHHITQKFSREDGLRVCGFIDVLLRIVDASVKVR